MAADCDLLVVGAGLIGSAAARHAAEAGASVVLVGPDEPRDVTDHSGVFASHYDEGRITRTLDRSPVWAELARRSIQRYGGLQEQTGIAFHEPRGFLRVDPPGSPAPEHVARVETLLGTSYERLRSPGLKERFPDFSFPEGYSGLLERDAAGVINPRRLVAAQQTMLRSLGGRVSRGVVSEVARSTGLFTVRTAEAEVRASSMIVATGAFAGPIQLTPEPVPLRLQVETVWMARVTDAEAQRMVAAPSLPGLWYEFDWHPSIPHIYLLPPIQYPDGHWYIKIGADTDPGVPLKTLEDVRRFFGRGGTASRAQELREVVHRIMPRLSLDEGRAKPCILCYTEHSRPFIHRYDDGTVVATGGNGASAKSSDEIGRLAARLALGLEADPVLEPGLFRIPD